MLLSMEGCDCCYEFTAVFCTAADDRVEIEGVMSLVLSPICLVGGREFCQEVLPGLYSPLIVHFEKG